LHFSGSVYHCNTNRVEKKWSQNSVLNPSDKYSSFVTPDYKLFSICLHFYYRDVISLFSYFILYNTTNFYNKVKCMEVITLTKQLNYLMKTSRTKSFSSQSLLKLLHSFYFNVWLFDIILGHDITYKLFLQITIFFIIIQIKVSAIDYCKILIFTIKQNFNL